MDNIPAYVGLMFILTTLTTLGFVLFGIFQAQENKNNKTFISVTVILTAWLGLVALLALNGFYSNFEAFPPRLVFALLPPTLAIIFLTLNAKSRAFLQKIPITTMTYLHIIRVPVEIVLWWMFLGGLVPKLMTFEGINYDILSGITAPFIAIFAVGFKNKRRIAAILWNFIALGLLFNIVGHALLSAPSPFQKLAFDMPNIGVFYFPFVWLPAFVVPAVLFAHIVSLLKLFERKNQLK